MVHYLEREDILALYNGLCDSLQPDSANWPQIEATLHQHIFNFVDDPLTGYMPSHKWLEFIAGCVEHAVTIASEPQLRANEARAMLKQVIGHDTPLYRQFKLEAALERARYEPVMLQDGGGNSTQKRDLLLNKRWHAMKLAQQEHAPLPVAMLDILDHAVDSAIQAPCFANYRIGPMLQFFAEMLQIARQLHHNGQASNLLADKIMESSTLWRRYALKSERFKEEEAKAIESFYPIWPDLSTDSRIH